MSLSPGEKERKRDSGVDVQVAVVGQCVHHGAGAAGIARAGRNPRRDLELVVSAELAGQSRDRRCKTADGVETHVGWRLGSRRWRLKLRWLGQDRLELDRSPFPSLVKLGRASSYVDLFSNGPRGRSTPCANPAS